MDECLGDPESTQEESFPGEVWKSCIGGAYEISNIGRFRRAIPGRRTWKGKVLCRGITKLGYWTVNPVISGKNVLHYIHALVAEAFIGKRPAGNDINHIDGDKKNSRVWNLEYVTHKENMHHARRMGLIRDKPRIHGEEKRTQIRSLREQGLSYSQIARSAGVSIAFAWTVVKGRDA